MRIMAGALIRRLTLRQNCIVLLCLALFAGRAGADEPITLDNQMIGEPAAAATQSE